jgi:hypothetical protein
VQFAARDHKGFSHPAVDVNSQDLQIDAAIRFVMAAGNAASAIEERFDRAPIARSHVPGSGADLDDFDAELMTENPWIAEKGLVSNESMDVGATHADAVNAHERLARCECRGRSRPFRRKDKATRFFKAKRLHFQTVSGDQF